jgi:hypothetical protein
MKQMTDLIKIYIAGPMRGMENCNYPEFYKAEEDLNRKNIYQVVNPARMDDDSGLGQMSDYKNALKRDIDEIFEVDSMYMLRGWEKSEGARVEHALAVYLGLYILYQ